MRRRREGGGGGKAAEEEEEVRWWLPSPSAQCCDGSPPQAARRRLQQRLQLLDTRFPERTIRVFQAPLRFLLLGWTLLLWCLLWNDATPTVEALFVATPPPLPPRLNGRCQSSFLHTCSTFGRMQLRMSMSDSPESLESSRDFSSLWPSKSTETENGVTTTASAVVRSSISSSISSSSNTGIGEYNPSEGIEVRNPEKLNVGNPQLKVAEREFSVNAILKELAAIQQQGPQKYCILGTRHCSFLHQQIIELLYVYIYVLIYIYIGCRNDTVRRDSSVFGCFKADILLSRCFLAFGTRAALRISLSLSLGRMCVLPSTRRHENSAYALVLSGNHVYTSGASGTNAATIRGALRAERHDLLTVVIPQSRSKQTAESQQLLQSVQNVIEMPQNNDLSLDIASRICNSYLLSLTDQLISFAFHESSTVIEATKKLDMLVTVLYLD
jgi:hypothetical protein